MKKLNWIAFGLLVGCALTVSVQAEEKKPETKTDAPKTEVKTEAPKKDPKDMTPKECEAAELCPNTKKPSKQVYHVEFEGTTYHFCTRNCQQMYKADPARYLSAGSKPPVPVKEEPKKVVDVKPLDKDKKKKEGMDDGMGMDK